MPKKFDPKDISGHVLCGAIKEHQLSLNEILARSLRQRSSPRLRFLVSHVVVVDALLGHFSVRADSCSILQGRAAPVQCPALGLHQPAVGVCGRPVAVWCHPPEPDRRRDGGNRRLDGQRAHRSQTLEVCQIFFLTFAKGICCMICKLRFGKVNADEVPKTKDRKYARG